MNPGRPRVLIAGAGVAGLETLLALRALAGDRVEITVVAPELRFINRSMAVDQPFKPQRVRGLRLRETVAGLGARWHRGALDRVEHAQHRAITKDGDALHYEILVLALGSRPEREWESKVVLTYHGGRDGPSYRLLLQQLREGQVNRVAFVRPAGARWPLPLYDLALMTAADCAAHDRSEVDLSLITPEEQPLGAFGSPATSAIRRLLRERRVALYTSSYGVPRRSGWLDISPGERCLPVDRVVSVPRLVGPAYAGSRAAATASSTPTLTAGWPAWMECSPPATRRPSRSSRAVWPPSRPMPSRRRSRPRSAPTSISSRSGRSCAESC
jgi:sulfide:quinone oxidoreductase